MIEYDKPVVSDWIDTCRNWTARRQPKSKMTMRQAEGQTASRIARRIRQFVRGVTASISVDELQRAAELLPPAAMTRFCRMPVDAQRHSMNVLAALHRCGWHDPELAASALLHDVGKVAASAAGLTFNAWVRTALVLVEAVAPPVTARLARNEPAAGWRYLLHIHVAHPRIGARWAEEDGCSPLTCWLIAHHQDKTGPEQRPPGPMQTSPPERSAGSQPAQPRERLLAALQWADSQN